MVKEIVGDMLEQKQGILCHQTNYEGVMGGGIAYAIWDRLLSDDCRRDYVDFCRKSGKNALGHVQFMFPKENLILANCFSQNGFNEADADGSITNYAEMRRCFETVRYYAEEHNQPVFIPYGMGCGIAGGKWAVVHRIIEDVFGNANVTVTIVRLEVR